MPECKFLKARYFAGCKYYTCANKNINYFDSKTKYKINKLGSFILDGNKLSKTLKNNLELPFRSLMTYECLNERYGPLMQENALNHIKYIDKHLSDIGGKQL